MLGSLKPVRQQVASVQRAIDTANEKWLAQDAIEDKVKIRKAELEAQLAHLKITMEQMEPAGDLDINLDWYAQEAQQMELDEAQDKKDGAEAAAAAAATHIDNTDRAAAATAGSKSKAPAPAPPPAPAKAKPATKPSEG